MFLDRANHPNNSLSANHFALVADWLNARTNLHNYLAKPRKLLRAENYPTALEIIRTQLNFHSVARENIDEIHPHFSRHMSQNDMSILKSYSKHIVWQLF